MNIVLTSHGPLCDAMIQSCEMVAGKVDNIYSVKLGEKGIGSFTQRLRELLDQLTGNGKVLILCDIKGGTPYNESYKYFLENPKRVRIVTGMNLPMLIELYINSNHEFDDACMRAEASGQQSIEYISVEKEHDNELEF